MIISQNEEFEKGVFEISCFLVGAIHESTVLIMVDEIIDFARFPFHICWRNIAKQINGIAVFYDLEINIAFRW